MVCMPYINEITPCSCATIGSVAYMFKFLYLILCIGLNVLNVHSIDVWVTLLGIFSAYLDSREQSRETRTEYNVVSYGNICGPGWVTGIWSNICIMYLVCLVGNIYNLSVISPCFIQRGNYFSAVCTTHFSTQKLSKWHRLDMHSCWIFNWPYTILYRGTVKVQNFNAINVFVYLLYDF